MTAMVEKVAKAIGDVLFSADKSVTAWTLARAAIEAMTHETEEMIQAGVLMDDAMEDAAQSKAVSMIYGAMIREALNTEEPASSISHDGKLLSISGTCPKCSRQDQTSHYGLLTNGGTWARVRCNTCNHTETFVFAGKESI